MGEDPEVVVGTRYRIESKIGCGSFGEIYTTCDMENGQQLAAKAERSDAKHPQLEFENRVYGRVPPTVGFPRIHWFGTSGRCNVLVMERLGPSLETLFTRCSRRFSLKTVCKIATQLIDRLRHLHQNNYIHRDLKPDNFLIGLGPKKKHTIFMIDMGLCKRYRDDSGDHIEYRENKRLTGTPRYASLASHKGSEQSRRDDLESLGYILVYFMKGKLPWMGLKARDKQEKYDVIGNKKREVRIPELCRDIPKEFGDYLELARSLSFKATPDYDSLKDIFVRLMKKNAYREEDKFDWAENNVDHLDLNPTGINPKIQMQTLQIRSAPRPPGTSNSSRTPHRNTGGPTSGNRRHSSSRNHGGAPGHSLGGGHHGVAGGESSPRDGHRHRPLDITHEHGLPQAGHHRSARHSPSPRHGGVGGGNVVNQHSSSGGHVHQHRGSPGASAAGPAPGPHKTLSHLPSHPNTHNSSYVSPSNRRHPQQPSPPSFQYKARSSHSRSHSQSRSHHAHAPHHAAAGDNSTSRAPGAPSDSPKIRRQHVQTRATSNGPTPVIDLSSETSASPPPVESKITTTGGSSHQENSSSSRLPSQPRAPTDAVPVSTDARAAAAVAANVPQSSSVDTNGDFPAPQNLSSSRSSNKRKGCVSNSRSPRRKKPTLSPAHDSSNPESSSNHDVEPPQQTLSSSSNKNPSNSVARHTNALQSPDVKNEGVSVTGVKRSRDVSFSHEHDVSANPPDAKKYVTAVRYEESEAERARLEEKCRNLSQQNVELTLENVELKEKVAKLTASLVSASASATSVHHHASSDQKEQQQLLPPTVDAGAQENESSRANQSSPAVNNPTPSSQSTVENTYDPTPTADASSPITDSNTAPTQQLVQPLPHRVPSPIDLDKDNDGDTGPPTGPGPGPGSSVAPISSPTPPPLSFTPPSPLPLPAGIGGGARGGLGGPAHPSGYQAPSNNYGSYQNPPPPYQQPHSSSSPLPPRPPSVQHQGSPSHFPTPPMPNPRTQQGPPPPFSRTAPFPSSGYPPPHGAPPLLYNMNPYPQPPMGPSRGGPPPSHHGGNSDPRWSAAPPGGGGSWRGGNFSTHPGPAASRFAPPGPHIQNQQPPPPLPTVPGGSGTGGGGNVQLPRSEAYIQSRLTDAQSPPPFVNTAPPHAQQ